MNFIGERETAGNVVKKRCSEIGMLFRILFWISLLFLAAKVIWTIYIGTMPEASFRLTLMEAEGLTYGVAAYEAGQRIEFQEGVLSYAASSAPKSALCPFLSWLIPPLRFQCGPSGRLLWGGSVRRRRRGVRPEEIPSHPPRSGTASREPSRRSDCMKGGCLQR